MDIYLTYRLSIFYEYIKVSVSGTRMFVAIFQFDVVSENEYLRPRYS